MGRLSRHYKDSAQQTLTTGEGGVLVRPTAKILAQETGNGCFGTSRAEMGDGPPEPEPEPLTFPLQNAPTTARSSLQEEVPGAPKRCTCQMPVHCGLRGLPEADDKLWGMARGEFRT